MGLGIGEELVDYLAKQKGDILGEMGETAGITAVVAGEKTLRPALASNLAADALSKHPIRYGKRFLRKAGPIGVAVSTGLDTYQGRKNAEKIFGKNTNMGQRAASVGSAIANGLSFGLFNFNDPKSIKNVYKYYGGK